MKPIDISIIYVNYKTSHLLENSISSLVNFSEGFSYEIIVVDNSSSDVESRNLERIVNRFGCTIIHSDNVGFGNANNIGVLHSHGKYVYFLNSDTLFISNACLELFKFLEYNPDTGIVGSNLYSLNMENIFSFQLDEKNLKNERKNASLVKIFGRRKKTINKTDIPISISGFVSGASLMMSKENFLKIGGFPKSIFLYAEEAYLCYSLIHKLNLKIYNIPSSRIIHLEGKSFDANERRIGYSCEGNFIYYTLIFGRDIAIKYLKLMISLFRRNAILSLITLQKNKFLKFKLFEKVYKNKLKEETSKNA